MSVARKIKFIEQASHAESLNLLLKSLRYLETGKSNQLCRLEKGTAFADTLDSTAAALTSAAEVFSL